MTAKGKAAKRGSCVYCGTPIDSRATTCAAHSDLPKLDHGVAAYRDRQVRVVGAAFLLYLALAGGLLGIVLWRLWTEVLAGVMP